MTELARTNRLIGSRMTEELIVETWYHVTGLYFNNGPVREWLESDAMRGRWCMPASGVLSRGGIYFELEEDATLFKMVWR